jgi:hypothetical protein
MSKTFRAWDVDQAWLLAPSVREFVPAGHFARFVRDTGARRAGSVSDRGRVQGRVGLAAAPCGHAGALLLYGCSCGIYSSRRLARACEERLDVMAATGLNRPDFRTISEASRRLRNGRHRAFAAFSDERKEFRERRPP